MSDPYVYPGTNVLRNWLNIRDQGILDLVEGRHADAAIFILKNAPLKLPISVARLKATHKAIFGEIYEWAGEFRQNIGAAAREALYRARDLAAMERKPEALAAIMRAGLRQSK